jgi:hypothetical protein
MGQTQQTAVQWRPLSDILETSCADFRLESFEDRRLVLTVRYSWMTECDNRDLKLGFSQVLAFRTHWDGDSPSVGKLVTWPLLIVENSDWLASGDFCTSNFGASQGHESWTQYSVISLERSVDIVARGAITANWTTGPDLLRANLQRPSGTGRITSDSGKSEVQARRNRARREDHLAVHENNRHDRTRPATCLRMFRPLLGTDRRLLARSPLRKSSTAPIERSFFRTRLLHPRQRIRSSLPA